MIAKGDRTGKIVKKESFMQGVLALMFSQVFIKLLGYVYRCYLTNRPGFGDDGNAIYSAGYNIYALLLTISSIGVPNAVSKLISERITLGDSKGAHRIFKVALATFSVIGLIGTLFLLFGAKMLSNMMGMPEAEMVLVVLSPSLFFVAICSVFRGFFNGQSKIKATANSQSLEQVFKTVFTIVAVELVVIFTGINTQIMAAGATVATTLSTMMSFFYLYTYYKLHRREKLVANPMTGRSNIANKPVMQIVKAILWVSIPMSLSAILTSLNRNIDSFTVMRLLQRYLPYEEARMQYGILSGKVELLTGLPLAFNVAFATALVPAIAAAKANKELQKGVKRISFSLLTTIVIVLPCVVGMVVFADPILKLIFPNAPDGAFIMQICVLATIFTAMEQTINGALQGLGKIFVPAAALTIGVLLKLILNLILVPIPTEVFPLGGVVGAAFATDICHLTAFCIVFTVLRKTVKLKMSFGKMIIKPLMASGMMALVSYGAYIVLRGIIAAKLATIIALIVAVIVYVLSILILRIFSKEDILMLPFGQKIYAILVKIGIYKQK
ncbi:MAG: polysaccharide biosynthesis protein [Clostridia bacterium]|nr:polysaccharide biosynthesis protein [Clostridia bacterium]